MDSGNFSNSFRLDTSRMHSPLPLIDDKATGAKTYVAATCRVLCNYNFFCTVPSPRARRSICQSPPCSFLLFIIYTYISSYIYIYSNHVIITRWKKKIIILIIKTLWCARDIYNKTDYIMSSGTSHVTVFTQGMSAIAHEARLSSTTSERTRTS